MTEELIAVLTRLELAARMHLEGLPEELDDEDLEQARREAYELLTQQKG